VVVGRRRAEPEEARHRTVEVERHTQAEGEGHNPAEEAPVAAVAARRAAVHECSSRDPSHRSSKRRGAGSR